MILVAFRSRLRPEAADAYADMAAQVGPAAMAVPGYVSHKAYTAADGERVTLVEYESDEAVRIWARDKLHAQAKRAGRLSLFSWYRVQICEVRSERRHAPEPAGDAQAPSP